MTEPTFTPEEKKLLREAIHHLETMPQQAGFRATDGSVICAYRSPAGCCVAGSLIGDENYSEELEGNTVYNLSVKNAIRKSHSGIILSDQFFGFLRTLQKIHDARENWDGDTFNPKSPWHERLARTKEIAS